ncbi:MAG: iron-containing redox enzyme family protein [Proteobacteria bacterium]|nr:iron-containing redox enzyme family protein [Pseudomonadota bacterium]
MSKIQEKNALLRQLVSLWSEFEGRLNRVPIIDRLNRGKMRIEDYMALLLNHRQQVVEGSRWIARAASSIESPFLEQRSIFMRHAATEHLDYQMLEQDYVNVGGNIVDIQTSERNIGTEALNAWMLHQASQVNPFDLLGAMFIIEGMGKNFASHWVQQLERNLGLTESQTQFYRYHAEHDETHMDELEEILGSGILEISGMADRIVKTTKVTGRLYLLQLEEIGNV